MVYDLSHTLGKDTMPYPGAAKPELKVAATMEANHYRETLINMLSHAGTHMDAPAHMLKDGAYLDTLPAERFCGRAYVMDCTGFGGDEEIPLSALPALEGLDFLILSTGLEAYWGDERYYGRYPLLSHEAADAVAESTLSGVGIDTMSVDAMDSRDYYVHRRLFSAGKVIIENLCNLEVLRGKYADICALPLKYENADGAPVRVAAFAD